MRQLLLGLAADRPPTLDTFVTGRNDELLQLLRRFAAGTAGLLGDRFAYLWGDSGSGRTHLLQALATAPFARLIAADAGIDSFRCHPDITLYLLDNCEQLSADTQIAAFNLFNEVRESAQNSLHNNAALLVATGNAPPATLAVREDLRTRLGWGLIYQVHGLSDEKKLEALTQAARSRGLTLAAGVLPYLMTHCQRDMRSLSAMLDALDQYSLETKRPITLPLLRSVLELESTPD